MSDESLAAAPGWLKQRISVYVSPDVSGVLDAKNRIIGHAVR